MSVIPLVNNAVLLCREKVPLSRDQNPNPERNFIKLQISALRSIDRIAETRR